MIFPLFLLLSIAVGGAAGHYLRRTFTPDDFRGRWYAWMTNQGCHLLLGCCLYAVLMGIHCFLTGELAVRWQVWLLLFLGYGAFEVMQRGEWRDMVEDTAFVAVYGGGFCFFVFHATTGGNFTSHIGYIFPAIGVPVLHVAWGVMSRWGRDGGSIQH